MGIFQLLFIIVLSLVLSFVNCKSIYFNSSLQCNDRYGYSCDFFNSSIWIGGNVPTSVDDVFIIGITHYDYDPAQSIYIKNEISLNSLYIETVDVTLYAPMNILSDKIFTVNNCTLTNTNGTITANGPIQFVGGGGLNMFRNVTSKNGNITIGHNTFLDLREDVAIESNLINNGSLFWGYQKLTITGDLITTNFIGFYDIPSLSGAPPSFSLRLIILGNIYLSGTLSIEYQGEIMNDVSNIIIEWRGEREGTIQLTGISNVSTNAIFYGPNTLTVKGHTAPEGKSSPWYIWVGVFLSLSIFIIVTIYIIYLFHLKNKEVGYYTLKY